MMGRLRKNLTFHYDPKTIEQAKESPVSKHPQARGAMSLRDEPHDWFFEPGDMVGDLAAAREIFKVPDGADVRERTDKIVNATSRHHPNIRRFCQKLHFLAEFNVTAAALIRGRKAHMHRPARQGIPV